MKYNYTQQKSDYETPPELLEEGLRLARIYTGYICDVCCSKKNVPALNHYINGIQNGLTENWTDFNWCNPPFNECAKWIKKAFEEQQKGNTTVMLLPVRTGTKYWHDYILFNPNVDIKWLRKGYKFIDSETQKELGIFKNALALVLFEGVENAN